MCIRDRVYSPSSSPLCWAYSTVAFIPSGNLVGFASSLPSGSRWSFSQLSSTTRYRYPDSTSPVRFMASAVARTVLWLVMGHPAALPSAYQLFHPMGGAAAIAAPIAIARAKSRAKQRTLTIWVHSSPVLCVDTLSLIHISEPTRLLSISYAVFCLKKKKRAIRERTRHNPGGRANTY
eukprot:TRINITY_DN28066_c0_g1_i1.p1 TRINITY_DN28066_c0_g1~~TRINITY_DN28066_c0_g1_i1.p1  ORF type:complete len:178 (-),score=26.31 TRINITY_DN28066_c0_g1_i1:23-556(-)